MSKTHARWGRSPAFAQYAEALGIRTDQVAAVRERLDGAAVLWSTDEAPDDGQYSELEKDGDGIWRHVGETRTIPDYFGMLSRLLEGE